jgi:hypothetical protein
LTNSAKLETVAWERPAILHAPTVWRDSSGPEALALAASAGLYLDAWQAWYLDQALREADGYWAASEVGINVPRQNGKGAILEARQITGLFLLREPLQIHTAHEFKTCYEHFLRVKSLIQSTPDLHRYVKKYREGSGEQSIELVSGERIRFLARSKNAGRGFSAPTIYLDEAYALVPGEIAAIQYAQSSFEATAQLWLFSSQALKTSTVFRGLRSRAILAAEGKSDEPRLLYAEWAALRDGNRNDPKQWARANPGFPHRIGPEAIKTELRTAGNNPELLANFDRERLGIIDESEDGAETVVDLALWASLAMSWAMTDPVALVLDVSPDDRNATLAAVEPDGDGLFHIDIVRRGEGTAWLVEACEKACNASGLSVSIDAKGPAGAHLHRLRAAGVPVAEVSSVEVGRAASSFIAAVNARRVRHLGNTSLANALTGATRTESGDSPGRWSRRTSTVDITPLVASSIALALAEAAPNLRPLFAN